MTVKDVFSVTRKEYFLCREEFSWKTLLRFGYHSLTVFLCASSGKGGEEQQVEGSEM